MPKGSIGAAPVIYPCLSYRDAPTAIEWLTRAFGFVKRAVHPGPDGTVAHAEMSFRDGVIMLGSPRPEKGWVSALDLPAVNQRLPLSAEVERKERTGS